MLNIRKMFIAAGMKDQVPGEIKNERSDRLIEKGEEIANRFFRIEAGNLRTALFEEITEEGLLTGFTENYVRVYAEPEGDPEKLLNEFCTVIMGTPFEDGMTAEIV